MNALVARASKLALRFAEVRIKWLQALACFAVGWFACC